MTAANQIRQQIRADAVADRRAYRQAVAAAAADPSATLTTDEAATLAETIRRLGLTAETFAGDVIEYGRYLTQKAVVDALPTAEQLTQQRADLAAALDAANTAVTNVVAAAREMVAQKKADVDTILTQIELHGKAEAAARAQLDSMKKGMPRLFGV